ncbi:hypothetical protein [uncultured Ramlibacter sp.]|uniref:hypothetical protein n=1 Tax=uncultured Ramlibacter sp. TaxID=260755 RepID=UPI00261E1E60|nr:hypothetical protein [uncultured Ramlibacter sp.]
MIQLASQANAARMGVHAAANDGKSRNFEFQRGRSGHAWPFISRHAQQPAAQDSPKAAGSSAGS